MIVFAPPPRIERAELIDSHEPSDKDFAESFADIARVNELLGGARAVQSALRPLIARLSLRPYASDGPVQILDIATGSADIPRALIREARGGKLSNRTLAITATDHHPKVLALAQRLTPVAEWPEITIAPADAFQLPYPNGAFDFALCSLAFHHFGPTDCITALREMNRVTTHGFIVNDLIRDHLARALAWTIMRVARANRLSKHDAPVSVMRAYTLPEYRKMGREAGIPNFIVRSAPIYRALLICDKTGYGSAIR